MWYWYVAVSIGGGACLVCYGHYVLGQQIWCSPARCLMDRPAWLVNHTDQKHIVEMLRVAIV
jgi:hypothetical protein